MKVIQTIKRIILLMINLTFVTRVVDKIEQQEKVKKKAKDGTLTIWDLI